MKSAAKKRAHRSVKYPAKASLRDMPERRRGAKTKPNKFAAKIAKAGGIELQLDGEKARWIPLPQGRPRKGIETEPSKPRAVRLPDSVWSDLQARAKQRGVGVHTLLRELVAAFLRTAA